MRYTYSCSESGPACQACGKLLTAAEAHVGGYCLRCTKEIAALRHAWKRPRVLRCFPDSTNQSETTVITGLFWM